MNRKELFRKEVLEKKINKDYGTVSINLPVKYKLVAYFFTVIISLIIIFIVNAKISEKYRVRGYINTDKGLVTVYPAQEGSIAKKCIAVGKKVSKEDILFVIDKSIHNAERENDNSSFNNLQLRKKIIHDEIVIKERKAHSLEKLLKNRYISTTGYYDVYQELLELKNKSHEIDAEIVRLNQDKSYSIRSTLNGIVSTVLYDTGQYIEKNKPLAQIIPSNSNYIAEISLPVAQSGFIKVGSKILLDYDSYPQEKFGRHKATVKEISKTILTDKDEIKPINIGEPYYKLKATLDNATVNVYGSKKAIQQGMTFTATIIGPERTILQWILDPLYSVYGRVFI